MIDETDLEVENVLTIDDILEIRDTHTFVRSPNLEVKGHYEPDAFRIRYDPLEINDERDFYVTLLHEIAHARDPTGETSEEEIENIAVRSYHDRKVRRLIKKLFSYKRCCGEWR